MSLITLGACDLCSGVGTLPHSSPGETYSCGTCNGHGVAKRGGYGGYKTPATAARAMANGNGRVCSYCSGTGTLTYPLTVSCYRCSDGVVVTHALPGQAWPEDAARAVRYQSGRGDGMAEYAAAVTIVVKAQDRAGTWNEAYLGLGSIVSCTDYGRVWDAMVAAAKADTLDAEVERVRELGRKALLDGCQWVKLTRDDGTLAEGIVVVVHRSGYTVVAANVTERAVVPPTYTAEVLNAPVR